MEMGASTMIFALVNIVLLLGMVLAVIALGIYLMRKNSSRQKCAACGKKIPADANLCPYCGQRKLQNSEEREQK